MMSKKRAFHAAVYLGPKAKLVRCLPIAIKRTTLAQFAQNCRFLLQFLLVNDLWRVTLGNIMLPILNASNFSRSSFSILPVRYFSMENTKVVIAPSLSAPNLVYQCSFVTFSCSSLAHLCFKPFQVSKEINSCVIEFFTVINAVYHSQAFDSYWLFAMSYK